MRGRQINIMAEHRVMKFCVHFGIGLNGGSIVGDAASIKKYSEHRAETIDRMLNILFRQGLLEAVTESFGFAIECGIDMFRLQQFQCLDTGGDTNRISRKGAGLIDIAERSQLVHEFCRSSTGTDGKTAADNLAQACQVGIDAKKVLNTSVSDSESCNDFIEDENTAVVGA